MGFTIAFGRAVIVRAAAMWAVKHVATGTVESRNVGTARPNYWVSRGDRLFRSWPVRPGQ